MPCRRGRSIMRDDIELDDIRVHVKVKLSALWASVMFLYLYGDYFGLYVPGKLQRMLVGHGPIGPTSQGSLLAASLILAAPGLMVFLSLALRPALGRWLNIILGMFFSLIVAATLPGAWHFYIALGVIEISLTLWIAWQAWRWPQQPMSGSVALPHPAPGTALVR